MSKLQREAGAAHEWIKLNLTGNQTCSEATVKDLEAKLHYGSVLMKCILLQALEQHENTPLSRKAEICLNDRNRYVRLRALRCLALSGIPGASQQGDLVDAASSEDAEMFYQYMGIELPTLFANVEKAFVHFLLERDSEVLKDRFLERASVIIRLSTQAIHLHPEDRQMLDKYGCTLLDVYSNVALETISLLSLTRRVESLDLMLDAQFRFCDHQSVLLESAVWAAVEMGLSWKEFKSIFDAHYPIASIEENQVNYQEAVSYYRTHGRRPISRTGNPLLFDPDGVWK